MGRARAYFSLVRVSLVLVGLPAVAKDMERKTVPTAAMAVIALITRILKFIFISRIIIAHNSFVDTNYTQSAFLFWLNFSGSAFQ